MLRRRCPSCARVFAGSERYCAHDATELVDVELDDARIGSVLAGRYRIGEQLGRGGMGVVYRAEQLPMERPVAVKLLRRDGDGASVERFMREARAMSALQSPHSVRLYDFGEADDGALYLVMELLTGESLRERLTRGPLPVDEAVAVLDEVARSLTEAHVHGIVHRDLTPANVFLCDAPGQPRFAKVLDFGIASLPWVGQARLTQTSELPGTPAYVAPERVSGEGAGPPADVYALGVLAYEMLTGAPPFEGDTAWDVLMAHLTDEPAPLAARAPEGAQVPADLEALVWRCLAKSPDLRPQDAGAFREALAAVAPEGSGEAVSAIVPFRPRAGLTRLALAAAAALIAGAVGGWLARGDGDLSIVEVPVIAPMVAFDAAPPEVARPAAGATPEVSAAKASVPASPDAIPVDASTREQDEGATEVVRAPGAEDVDVAPIATPPAPARTGTTTAPSAPRPAAEDDDRQTAESDDPAAVDGPNPLLIEQLLGDPPPPR